MCMFCECVCVCVCVCVCARACVCVCTCVCIFQINIYFIFLYHLLTINLLFLRIISHHVFYFEDGERSSSGPAVKATARKKAKLSSKDNDPATLQESVLPRKSQKANAEKGRKSKKSRDEMKEKKSK